MCVNFCIENFISLSQETQVIYRNQYLNKDFQQKKLKLAWCSLRKRAGVFSKLRLLSFGIAGLQTNYWIKGFRTNALSTKTFI